MKGSRILMMGLTFKENCPDLRNSKVVDVIKELKKYGAKVDVYDPWIDAAEARARVRHQADPHAGEGPLRRRSCSRSRTRSSAKWASTRSARFAKKPHVLYDIKYVFERRRGGRTALASEAASG